MQGQYYICVYLIFDMLIWSHVVLSPMLLDSFAFGCVYWRTNMQCILPTSTTAHRGPQNSFMLLCGCESESDFGILIFENSLIISPLLRQQLPYWASTALTKSLVFFGLQQLNTTFYLFIYLLSPHLLVNLPLEACLQLVTSLEKASVL